jgi:hypothetical protein
MGWGLCPCGVYGVRLYGPLCLPVEERGTIFRCSGANLDIFYIVRLFHVGLSVARKKVERW